MVRALDAGRMDSCVHVSSVLGSVLSQVCPRSPRLAKFIIVPLRVEFLLKTDSGYPRMRKLFDSPWQTMNIPSALTPIGQLHQSLLRVEFLLKTDSGYPKDTGVNKPWQPLGIPFAITLSSTFESRVFIEN